MTMGLEWHDRRRDLRGRFDRAYEEMPDQVHIRCTRKEGQMIRDFAVRDRKELSEWCRDVLMDHIARRLQLKRLTENGQK